jgi:hypothetical protein
MSSVRRHPIIVAGGVLAAVVAALVIAAVASGQVGIGGEPTEEELAAGEATAAAIRATVTPVYPRYDENPPDPEFYGPFWLYPAGYEGEWPVVPTFEPCAKPSVDGADPAVIRAADIYVDIEDLPPGLTAAQPTVRNICGSEVTSLRWVLDGPGGVEIARWRASFPHAITIPPSHSWLELEKASVLGYPAVFLKAKPGRAGPVTIYVAQDEYITSIIGEAYQFDDLAKLAESIVAEAETKDRQ